LSFHFMPVRPSQQFGTATRWLMKRLVTISITRVLTFQF
jgi:hypothetical protein